MKCCDEYGNCNQGRDCPARLAKVKHRYPKHPESVFRFYVARQLKALAKWALLAILGWVFCVPVLYLLLRA